MRAALGALIYFLCVVCTAYLHAYACLGLLGLPAFHTLALHATVLILYAFENWGLHQDLTQKHPAEIKTLDAAHLDVINSLSIKNFAARKRIQETEAQIEELQKQIGGYKKLKIIYTKVWHDKCSDQPTNTLPEPEQKNRLKNQAFSASWSEDSTRPRPI